jgi:glycosyltransferase involved in cell wall biosynthesis
MKYSIIIPLYNKGEKVKRAIDSVLRQPVADFEVLVIDDGSTDDSSLYVKTYQDQRVLYIYKENGGVSSARNRGIREAQGQWLLFLDADDELVDDALAIYERMMELFPHSRFLVGNYQQPDCHVTQYWIRHTSHPFLQIWLNHAYPSPRNMLLARSLTNEYGLFGERQSFYEDLEFILRMCRAGEFSYTNQPTGLYHQEENGLSNSAHPVEKEMAYYIPEIIAKRNISLLEKAILYDNIEQEIAWWEGHQEETAFYRKMQKKHFAWYFKQLHWLRQQLHRHGII